MQLDSRRAQEFVHLLTDHQEVLRSYIFSLLPNSPDVRDVLQEVNIRLWERMGDFEPGTNFGAWACTVAHYKILDHRKQKKRDGFLVFNDDLCESLAAESEHREPDLLEAKRRALQYCLKRLSTRDSEIVRARYADRPARDTMEQLAAHTGRSRASLRVSLRSYWWQRIVTRGCIAHAPRRTTTGIVEGSGYAASKLKLLMAARVHQTVTAATPAVPTSRFTINAPADDLILTTAAHDEARQLKA